MDRQYAAGSATQTGDDVWTIGRMLKWTTAYLGRKGDEHPRLSAEWLINNVTGLSRVQIYMSFDRRLTQDELAAMHTAVVRRAKGEPLQYVTGEMPFRHIVLRCERGVLIPRPETEVLVDAALEGVDAAVARGDVYHDVDQRARAREAQEALVGAQQGAPAQQGAASAPAVEGGQSETGGRALSSFVGDSSHDAATADDLSDETFDPIVPVAGPEQSYGYEYIPGPEDNAQPAGDEALETWPTQEAAPAPHEEIPAGPRVLEIGCGTGCIDLSIASERPGTFVVATDLAPQAVALARRNRSALGLDDSVSIMQCDLASAVSPSLMGTFAVLVSNPPYIPSAVVPTLPEEVVGYEPGLALDGGADGLDVFRRILQLAPQALAPGGMLCCELFETTVGTAADLTRSQGGWRSVEVREDLTHRPRVLVAVRA